MTPPDQLQGRERRLKSLDEFEPLPWHRKRSVSNVRKLALLAIIGIVIGGSIGWVLAG